MAGPHTARAQARVQMLTEIRGRALRQLAEEGAAGLSLRAIARDLGLVSSGIYRYYANRDDLLTALIVEAYDDLAAAVRQAAGPDGEPRPRFLARWGAFRRWALTSPARFQLLYGSPVPGYRAPAETVGPATAVLLALLEVLPATRPAAGSGRALDPTLTDQLVAVAGALDLDLPAGTLSAAVAGFAELVGLVTLELGGHLVGGFEPAGPLADRTLADLADRLALPDLSDAGVARATPASDKSGEGEGQGRADINQASR